MQLYSEGDRLMKIKEDLCPHCSGTGRVKKTLAGAGRAGGNQAYLNSLKPGAVSMSDRSKRAKRLRALTLADIQGN